MPTAKKAKRPRKAAVARKIPRRRVPSDDFIAVLAGEKYQPHAGEWVEFEGSASVDEMIISLRLQKVRTSMKPEEAEEMAELLREVVDHLANNISGWSWTDNGEKPYQSPPDAATLRSLSFEELGYLVTQTFGRTEADQKNG